MRTRQQKKTTGSKIRAARIAAGLTQRKAAEKINVTPIYLCYIEHDQGNPSLGVVRRLAKLYGVEPGELIA